MDYIFVVISQSNLYGEGNKFYIQVVTASTNHKKWTYKKLKTTFNKPKKGLISTFDII